MPAGRPKKSSRTFVDVLVSHEEKRQALRESFMRGLKLEPTIDLDAWADLYRVLPRETSSEYGPWKTSRFPFLRKIMKKLSPSSRAKEIVVMKGAQLGFTELSINWILYNADCRPGPMTYVQKTIDAVKDFSTQKLTPGIDACARVAETLGKSKSKKYSNSFKNKGYPGGFVVLGAANSASFLKSKSIRDAVMDEEDEYEASIENQGAPRKMLSKRQANFPDGKLYRISTPVLAELSTIEPGYLAGSQEEFYLPCPHCNPAGDHKNFMFVLCWNDLKWSKELNEDNLPKDVWYECPNCAGYIDEAKHKTWMLDRGEWFSKKDSKERYIVGDVLYPSFKIPSFYSPYGFYSWSDAVKDFFEYKEKNDVNLLQVLVNQVWAETFTLTGHDIDYNHIYARREDYCGNLGDFDVPVGALALTAGVDIQDDRIEIEVVGWGLLEENWSIDYKVIPGDTALMGDAHGMLPSGQPSVWRLLDDYLMKRWNHQCGVSMPIEVTMIDAGYKTEEVHTFCRLRESRRVFPVKGVYGWGKGLWSATRRRHERYGTFTYSAHVDELKTKVYAQLRIEQPGPGYCHYPKKPMYDEKYFKGLTCETLKVKMVKGRQVLYWDTPSGARNEPIDLRDYAYVAFSAYPANLEARAEAGLKATFGGQSSGRGIRRRRKGSKGL